MINIKDKLKRSNILIKRTNDVNVEYVPLSEFESDIKALNERINELSGIDVNVDNYVTKTEFNSEIDIIRNQIEALPEKKVNANGINFSNSTFEELSDAFYFGDATNFKGIFKNCPNLKRVNADLTGSMATSNDKSEMFYACGALEEAPDFNALRVTNMAKMFYNCYALQTAPSYNILECETMSYMFYSCSNLTSVGNMDENPDNWLRDVSRMFMFCDKLTIAPRIKTTHVTNFDEMFAYCARLETAPEYDASSATSANDMFGNALVNFGGLKNLKIDFTGIRNCMYLSYESIINVLNGLYDFRSNGDSTTTRTLQLNYHSMAQLSDADKAIATNKGWILTT